MRPTPYIISTCCAFHDNSIIYFAEEYAQYYGQMNTMGGRGMMKQGQQQPMGQHDGVPYEEMGYGGMPPPNRKLPPVPGQHSNYNTIDRIKNGEYSLYSPF